MWDLPLQILLCVKVIFEVEIQVQKMFQKDIGEEILLSILRLQQMETILTFPSKIIISKEGYVLFLIYFEPKKYKIVAKIHLLLIVLLMMFFFKPIKRYLCQKDHEIIKQQSV